LRIYCEEVSVLAQYTWHTFLHDTPNEFIVAYCKNRWNYRIRAFKFCKLLVCVAKELWYTFGIAVDAAGLK
jgi:hypothetical protein